MHQIHARGSNAEISKQSTTAEQVAILLSVAHVLLLARKHTRIGRLPFGPGHGGGGLSLRPRATCAKRYGVRIRLRQWTELRKFRAADRIQTSLLSAFVPARPHGRRNRFVVSPVWCCRASKGNCQPPFSFPWIALDFPVQRVYDTAYHVKVPVHRATKHSEGHSHGIVDDGRLAEVEAARMHCSVMAIYHPPVCVFPITFGKVRSV
jgi:hypothetical protein